MVVSRACSGRLDAGDLYDKNPAQTGTAALPGAAALQNLVAYPARIALRGGDDAQQLVLTAVLKDSRAQDLSGDVKYEIADPKIARVSTSGRVVPLANGSTEITAGFGASVVKIPVSVEAVDVNLP